MNQVITDLRNAIENVRDGRWSFAAIDNGNGNIVQFKASSPNELYVEISAPYWGDVEAKIRELRKLGFSANKYGSRISSGAEEMSEGVIYVKWTDVADVRPFSEEVSYIFQHIFGEELREYQIHSDVENIERTLEDMPPMPEPTEAQQSTVSHAMRAARISAESNRLRDILCRVLFNKLPNASITIDDCTVSVESPNSDTIYIKAKLPTANASVKRKMKEIKYNAFDMDDGTEFRKIAPVTEPDRLFNEIKYIFRDVAGVDFDAWLVEQSIEQAKENNQRPSNSSVWLATDENLRMALNYIRDGKWDWVRISVGDCRVQVYAESIFADKEFFETNISFCDESDRNVTAGRLFNLGYKVWAPDCKTIYGKTIDLHDKERMDDAIKELRYIFERVYDVKFNEFVVNFYESLDVYTYLSSVKPDSPDLEPISAPMPVSVSAASEVKPEVHDASTKYRDMYKEEQKCENSKAGCFFIACILCCIVWWLL